MSCYAPLPAYKHGGVVRVGRPPSLLGVKDEMWLPCGKCIGCKLDRARAWSIRIMHEAQLHDEKYFITFDYDPAAPSSPENTGNWSLQYAHWQQFMRRLRKALGHGRNPVRFFVSGEYGRLRGRPHWHACMFGLRLDDRQRMANGKYHSGSLESCWSHGRCDIGEVTSNSAAYCAGYTLNKAYGRDSYDLVDRETGEVIERRPPFVRMSLKPGIGAEWYKRFGSDLFPHDFAVQDGRRYKVPRYYVRKLEAENPQLAEEVAHGRYLKSLEIPSEEKTDERLQVKAEYYEARSRFYSPREN